MPLKKKILIYFIPIKKKNEALNEKNPYYLDYRPKLEYVYKNEKADVIEIGQEGNDVIKKRT